MRAHTKGKDEMGKRFAIVIGVAAAGVMALGAQTAVAGGESVDSVKPDLKLSGPKRQNPQADGPICDRGLCDVKVRVSCGDEECSARATKGKLTKVNKDKLRSSNSWGVHSPDALGPGKTATVGLELGRAQRREVRKALAHGKNVQAKVTVRAKDAAGNVATAKRTIRLVK
jgi:hypothetical protein